MAELIPIQYRLRTAQKQQLEKWTLGGIIAVALALASLTYAFVWQHKRAGEHAALAAEYQQKSTAINQSHQAVASRLELANRMEKVQQLMDDKTLLALLRNISGGFSSSDSLEYISIDTHAKTAPTAKPGEKDAPPPPEHYLVRLTGITTNSATLSDLVDRLSHVSSPAMNVILDSSHRETMFDGQVMRFEISCEQPLPKGT